MDNREGFFRAVDLAEATARRDLVQADEYVIRADVFEDERKDGFYHITIALIGPQRGRVAMIVEELGRLGYYDIEAVERGEPFCEAMFTQVTAVRKMEICK